jgi:hypothetical protein
MVFCRFISRKDEHLSKSVVIVIQADVFIYSIPDLLFVIEFLGLYFCFLYVGPLEQHTFATVPGNGFQR